MNNINTSISEYYSNTTLPYDQHEMLFTPIIYIMGSLITSVYFIKCLRSCNMIHRPVQRTIRNESDIRTSIIDDNIPVSDIESVNLDWIKVLNASKKKKISDKNLSCCICLDKITSNGEIGQLLCEHYFHYKCIQEWFNTIYDNKCPLCKMDISIMI